MLPIDSIARNFKDYNIRYFSLNLELLELSYSAKPLLKTKGIRYIPLEVNFNF